MARFDIQIEVSPRPDVSRSFAISTSKRSIKRDCSRELLRFTDDELSIAAVIERFNRDGFFAYCVCQCGTLIKISYKSPSKATMFLARLRACAG